MSMVNIEELCNVLRKMNSKSNRHLAYGVIFAWYAYSQIKMQEREIRRLRRDIKNIEKEFMIRENTQCDD